MKTHIYKTRVRYSEVDFMGIVHNSKYLVFFEEARVDLVRVENYPYKEIEDNGMIFPISDARLLYKIPIVYDEIISVEVNVEYVKNVSAKFKYVIKKEDGNIACEGYTVHACIDKNTKDFVDIPDRLIKILNMYLINEKH